MILSAFANRYFCSWTQVFDASLLSFQSKQKQTQFSTVKKFHVLCCGADRNLSKISIFIFEIKISVPK